MSNNGTNMPFGFLNINKPKGMTSFDVISKLRKILNIKQIGHAGTLDPFATGVLPIAIGKATKILEFLPSDKKYIATVQFGKNTTTYDLEGEITDIFDKKVSKEEILEALKNFEGEILQIPPIYSAIKKEGKKLYEYAREGKTIEITPRKITIHKINLIEFDKISQQGEILVECSGGTYIRSIAYDLGKSLNCGAHLIELERTMAGKFLIDNSIKLEDIKDKEFLIDKIINPIDVTNIKSVNLTDSEAKKISHGIPINNNGFQNLDIVFLVYSGKIHGIGLVAKDKILAKKVFEVL